MYIVCENQLLILVPRHACLGHEHEVHVASQDGKVVFGKYLRLVVGLPVGYEEINQQLEVHVPLNWLAHQENG